MVMLRLLLFAQAYECCCKGSKVDEDAFHLGYASVGKPNWALTRVDQSDAVGVQFSVGGALSLEKRSKWFGLSSKKALAFSYNYKYYKGFADVYTESDNKNVFVQDTPRGACKGHEPQGGMTFLDSQCNVLLWPRNLHKQRKAPALGRCSLWAVNCKWKGEAGDRGAEVCGARRKLAAHEDMCDADTESTVSGISGNTVFPKEVPCSGLSDRDIYFVDEDEHKLVGLDEINGAEPELQWDAEGTKLPSRFAEGHDLDDMAVSEYGDSSDSSPELEVVERGLFLAEALGEAGIAKRQQVHLRNLNPLLVDDEMVVIADLGTEGGHREPTVLHQNVDALPEGQLQEILARDRHLEPPSVRDSVMAWAEQLPDVDAETGRGADGGKWGKRGYEPGPSMQDRQPPKPEQPVFAIAVHAFDGNGAAELPLRVGDRVQVMKKREDGWVGAKNVATGKSGWCPATFLKAEAEAKAEQREPKQGDQVRIVRGEQPRGGRARDVYTVLGRRDRFALQPVTRTREDGPTTRLYEEMEPLEIEADAARTGADGKYQYKVGDLVSISRHDGVYTIEARYAEFALKSSGGGRLWRPGSHLQVVARRTAVESRPAAQVRQEPAARHLPDPAHATDAASFERNEIVTIRGEGDRRWQVMGKRNMDGTVKYGLKALDATGARRFAAPDRLAKAPDTPGREAVKVDREPAGGRPRRRPARFRCTALMSFTPGAGARGHQAAGKGEVALTKGETVLLLQDNPEKGWAAVKGSHGQGWVPRSALGGANCPAATPGTAHVRRSAAGAKAEHVGVITEVDGNQVLSLVEE